MRLSALIAAVGLVFSAFFAPRVHRNREPEHAGRRLVVTDLKERARIGIRQRALGVAYMAFEEAANRDPGDLEALRGRIRTGILLGAVALGEPRLTELVAQNTDAYVENRDRVDPDGTLLQEALRAWCALRMEHPYWYARCAVAIYLAARGDDKGFKALRGFMEKGPFSNEFFPYARRFHPAWRGVGPLVEHYLGGGKLGGRVEAATTLLDYNVLFGEGKRILERRLPAMRRAFEEMKARLRSPKLDSATWAHGAAALFGMAMLANLGYTEERDALARMDPLHDCPNHADVFRVARIWAGLDPFERYPPTSRAFKIFPDTIQEQYFRAAAHRAAVLKRELVGQTDPARRKELKKQFDDARDLVEAGFLGSSTVVRVTCMEALAAIDGARAQPMLQEVVLGRGVPSLFAASLVDQLDDPVAVYLPGLRSPEPDYAALAAVSLLDLGEARPIERPRPGST